jgi:hypothetical protein
MPSFLSIPQELRDQIIDTVLLDELKPSQDIKSAEVNRLSANGFKYQQGRSWRYGPSHVRYERQNQNQFGWPSSSEQAATRANQSHPLLVCFQMA